MNSKLPRQGTQPQQWTTANGTPSPVAPTDDSGVDGRNSDVNAKRRANEAAPSQSQVMALDPDALSLRLDEAASALEPTAAALPNPVAYEETAMALPHVSALDQAASALEPTDVALPNPVAFEPTMPAMAGMPGTPGANNIPENLALGVAKTQVAANSYRSSDPSAPLPPGFELGGRYVIERHISSGSFGAVYKAADRAIPNHAVALKVLHIPAESDDAREKGLRELRLIASVAHPSVVQFKDYGWFEGRLWFAMPWYSGHTLYDRIGGDDITMRMPLTRAEARPIFERLAQGLAAMHAVGIHHHDIKPENVFLANVAGFEGGFPVLLDLGIAAQKGELPAGFTAEYAAPETANTALGVPGHAIGAAADVFALALTLRNVLDPDLIVDAEVPSIAILTARASQETPGPARKDLAYLKPYFARWLSPDPSVRPTPEEFAAELSVLTAPEERREQRMRMLRRAAPFIAVALMAVSVLAYQVTKQREVVKEQRAVITVQEEKLNLEAVEHDRLRQQSQSQLAELEATKSQVGDKDTQLKRALAIAHDLDRQMSRLEQVKQTLTDRLNRADDDIRALRTERDGLTYQRDRLLSERDGLVAERDNLAQQRNALRSERDNLLNERTTLRNERDGLLSQIQDVERARNALADERDNLRRSVDAFVRERDNVAAERDGMRRERDNANSDVARLRTQLDAMVDERNRLRAENASLREHRGEAPAPTNSAPAPEATPGAVDQTQDQMERQVRRRRRTAPTTITPTEWQ